MLASRLTSALAATLFTVCCQTSAAFELALTAGAGVDSVATSEHSDVTTQTLGANGIPTNTTVRTEISSESGQLATRQLAATWTGEGYFVGGSIYNADGNVSYQGLDPVKGPIPNGSSYLYVWRTNTYLGKTFADLPLQPRLWIELGGQLKERHITTRVPEVANHHEDFTWWTAGSGLELEIWGDNTWQWSLGGAYRSILAPTNKSSRRTISLDLGDSFNYSAYTQLKYQLGAGFYIETSAGFTATQMAAGRKFYEGNKITPIIQPEAAWRDMDLTVKLGKQF